MPASEIDNLKIYFDSKYSHVSHYWLECCIKWFKDTHKNYTQQSMCEQIYEQWLLSDLRDIEVKALPPNLSEEKKFVLNGSYVVQLMYLKDISKSSLSQLRKIRDLYKLTRSITDTENEPFGKRVLYLNLTDGVQYINAFEHEHVLSLNINLSPGVKLLLTGPLFIRNGEILLKNNNIKVLGGLVEELLVQNAVENILARELKLPENPNPHKLNFDFTNNITGSDTMNKNTDTQLKLFIKENIKNETCSSSSNQVTQGNLNNVIVITSDDENEMFAQQQTLTSDPNDEYLDDDIFADIDIDKQLDKIEEQSALLQEKQNLNEEFLNIDTTNIEYEEQNLVKQSLNIEESLNANVDDEIEMLEKIEIEMKYQETPPPKISIVTTSEPFVYIKQLLNNKNKIKPNQQFKLRAHFLRVIEKLSLKRTRGWTMKFEISDGTDKMIVDFTNNVIEELMGLSTAEALAEKLKVHTKSMFAFEKISEALARCKKKLHSFDGVMTVQYYENNDIPTIIHIESIEKEHLDKLKTRVESVQI